MHTFYLYSNTMKTYSFVPNTLTQYLCKLHFIDIYLYIYLNMVICVNRASLNTVLCVSRACVMVT